MFIDEKQSVMSGDNQQPVKEKGMIAGGWIIDQSKEEGKRIKRVKRVKCGSRQRGSKKPH